MTFYLSTTGNVFMYHIIRSSYQLITRFILHKNTNLVNLYIKTENFDIFFIVDKMLLNRLVIVVFLPFCFTKSVDVTFKEVTFRGYNIFIEKFGGIIPSGNRLKDFLPNSEYDDIEIKNQTIPVLYKDSLSDLEDLDKLVIEFCHVEEIRPGAISNAPGLRKLSLKGNKIRSIEFGVFNNLNISKLNLILNQISSIHGNAFDDMSHLEEIQLADNNIQIWNPEWFKNAPLLARISIPNNIIEELPANAFKNIKGMNEYGKLNFTIHLDFSHNKIKHIDPKAFSDLEKIKNLWLDNNLLQEFHEDLLNGITIDNLRLHNNNIKCFDADLDKTLKANTNHIDSNLFNCDCLKLIKEWLKKNKKVELSVAELNCSDQEKTPDFEKSVKEAKEKSEEEQELQKQFEELDTFV